jgi:hypothetical protein
MNLEGIIEKTVDLQAWFEERTSIPEMPFAFQSLVKYNLDQPRIPSTNKTNQLWLTNRKDQVFEINENNCANLLVLWSKMILKRELDLPVRKTGRQARPVRRLRMNDVDLKVLTGGHFFFDAELWSRFLKFPATNYSWARALRTQASTIGCGENRREKRYEAIRCRTSAKWAVFFIERFRSFKLNKLSSLGNLP